MKTLNLKIDDWSKYKSIVVVGPNRSGSTFFSNYIASRLNFFIIDEEAHRYKDSIFKYLLNAKIKKVIQCPGYFCTSHIFTDDDILYVVMIRDIEDIIKSSSRIGGKVSEASFKRVYGRYQKYIGDDVIQEYKPKRLALGESAIFRYKVWNEYQKDKSTNFIEVNFNELEQLDGYIEREKRINFTKKQISKVNKTETIIYKIKKRISYYALLIVAFLSGYRD